MHSFSNLFPWSNCSGATWTSSDPDRAILVNFLFHWQRSVSLIRMLQRSVGEVQLQAQGNIIDDLQSIVQLRY